MTKRQTLALIGSVILFVGVFMPIISVPVMGSVNYFQNGRGDGTIIIALAAVSLILVARGKYKGLWFTGVGSLGMMVFSFVSFRVRMSQAQAEPQAELADNTFAGLGELAMKSVQLQWGWAVLVVAAAMVIAAAALKEETT